MTLNKTLQDYKTIDFVKLRRIDLGPRSFDAVNSQIMDLKQLYDQIIKAVERTENLPQGLLDSITNSVNRFVGEIVTPINGYNYVEDERRQFNHHNRITAAIQQFHSQTFNAQVENPLLTIASAVRMFDLKGLTDSLEDTLKRNDLAKKELDEARTTYEALNIETQNVLSSLRSKASTEVLEDYANIFHKQAQRHSAFSFSLKKILNTHVGAAYYWITAGIVLIVLGISNLHKLDLWFPLPTDHTDTYGEVGAILKRIVLISFWVYGVGFSFKQFSINKHLYTINKHRENALNSFKLFIETIGTEDSVTRGQLMLQVAKAIYEQGNTGYLHQKGDMREPSIVELTRFMTPKQG